jgi:hypothetical protein
MTLWLIVDGNPTRAVRWMAAATRSQPVGD